MKQSTTGSHLVRVLLASAFVFGLVPSCGAELDDLLNTAGGLADAGPASSVATKCPPCVNGHTIANRYLCLSAGERCANSTLPCCTDECEDHEGACFNPGDIPSKYLTCDKKSDRCVLASAAASTDAAADASSSGTTCDAVGTWTYKCPASPTPCGPCGTIPVATIDIVIPSSAADGGTFYQSGQPLSFDRATCTLSFTGTCNNQYRANLATGRATSTYVCTSGCTTCGTATCTITKK